MLQLHRSNRMERLAEVFLEATANDRLGPFDKGLVVTQSQGMWDWLTHKMARRHGVSGGYEKVTPQTAIVKLCDALLGPDEATQQWSRTHIFWLLLAQISAAAGHEGSSEDWAIWAGQARRLGDAFDQMVVYRPKRVATLLHDETLPNDVREAWQMLRDRLKNTTVADRVGHALACDPAAAETLPKALHVFGVSSMPPLFLRLLDHVARVVPIHIYQLSPSEAYLGGLENRRKRLRRARREGEIVSEEELSFASGHELLASLARSSADLMDLFLDHCEQGVEVPHWEEPTHPGLLGHLQRDLLACEPTERPAVSWREDMSLTVHRCPGPSREAEVAADQVRHALERLEEVYPRDVLVLCPDIATYGPLCEVAFQGVPMTVVDRPAVVDNPAAAVLEGLLDLMQGRWTVPDVMRVVGEPAVCEAHELTQEDLVSLRERLEACPIYWGVHGTHRAEVGAIDDEAGTWDHGVKRLLLGLTSGSELPWSGVTPAGGLGDGDSTTLGTFFNLYVSLRELYRPRAAWSTCGELIDTLHRVLSALLETPHASNERLPEVLLALSEIKAATQVLEPPLTVPGELVVKLVRDWLDGERQERGFLRNVVTVAEALPMRAIPYKVVVFMGLEEGAFPRSDAPVHRALMGQRQRGDRSRRDDDRALFLEAVLSARERLVLTYNGHDPVTGEARPASSVLEETVGALSKICGVEADALVVSHPLHAWSLAYRDPSADPRAIGYARFDGQGRAWSSALEHAPRVREPWWSGPLPAASHTEVSIRDFVAFFKNPAAAWMEQRLSLRRLTELRERADARSDDAPLLNKGLDAYSALHDVLELLNKGYAISVATEILEGEGRFEKGPLGEHKREDALTRAGVILEAASERRPGDRLEDAVVQVSVEVDGLTVTGALDGLHTHGRLLQSTSRLNAHPGRERLKLWVHHLIGQASGQQHGKTVMVGEQGGVGWWLEAAAMPAEVALGHLTALVRQYRAGMNQPLYGLPDQAWKVVSGKDVGDKEKYELPKLAAAWGVEVPERLEPQRNAPEGVVADGPTFGTLADAWFVPMADYVREGRVAGEGA